MSDNYQSTDCKRFAIPSGTRTMCVAVVLILHNFYQIYDTALEYCEHITAAFVILITVAMIMVPVMYMLTEVDGDGETRFLGIVVLVCGVLGGLIMVLSFILFCKYCFKKKRPFSVTNQPISPSKKRLDINQKGYRSTDTGGGITTPLPINIETYLQQPAQAIQGPFTYDEIEEGMVKDYTKRSLNNNNNNNDRDFRIGSIHTNLDNNMLYAPVNDEVPEDIVADQMTEPEQQQQQQQQQHRTESSLFYKCSPKRDISSLRNPTPLSMNPPSAQVIAPGGTGSLHAPAENRSRSHSFVSMVADSNVSERHHYTEGHQKETDACELSTEWPTSPRNVSITAEIHAHPNTSAFQSPSARLLPVRYSDEAPPRRSFRSPIGQLPRSRQIVIDRTSPPPPQVRKVASEDWYESSGSRRLYGRHHNHSRSYPLHVVASSDDSPGLLDHPHVVGLPDEEVLMKFVPEPPPVQPSSDIYAGAPAEAPDQEEYESINRFYQQCQRVFARDGLHVSANASSSSTSSSEAATYTRPQRVGSAVSPASRGVRSLEILEHERRLPRYNADRPTKSLDTGEISVESLNRLSLLSDDAMTRGLRVQDAGTALTRQETLDEEEPADAERERLEEQEVEQVRAQCKELWALRSELEQRDDVSRSPSPLRCKMMPTGELDEGSFSTSYTTSFESNTEVLMPEGSREHRRSSTYLEPPASYESRRQKYKNLLTRRKLHLQAPTVNSSFETTGNSVERSMESFDSTGTESSRPEFIGTSFESNASNVSFASNCSNVSNNDSNADSGSRKWRIAEMKNDSGYKSQSADGSQAPVAWASGNARLGTAADQLSAVRDAINTLMDASGGGDCNVRQTSEPAQQSPNVDRYGGVYDRSRERRATDLFFDIAARQDCDTYSVRSDMLSGDSFDELPITTAPTNGDTCRWPPAVPRRLRRHGATIDSPSAPHHYHSRDYSIDTKTDTIFKEFLRFDPQLETKKIKAFERRMPRFRYANSVEYDSRGSPKRSGRPRPRLSPEHSIEEEENGRQTGAMPQLHAENARRGCLPDIPIIKLNTDEELSGAA